MPSSRRVFLQSSAVAVGGFFASSVVEAAPTIKGIERKNVSLDRYYHGWPTLARRKSGELLLVCSGGRESHVCPFGRVELIRSHDNGKTWTWPEIVLDGPLDDRDAGVLETRKGTLLVTSFTSEAYTQQPYFPKKSSARYARWMAAHRRISDAQRKAALGSWMIRSTDGGISWSKRFDCQLNSPHGPIELDDGNLLYAGKDLYRSNRIGAAASTDDGRSWKWLGKIPTRPGDDFKQYHELHAVQCKSGTIVAHIRNHNPKNAGETLQSHSTDGGVTWSVPRSIGVWGLPSHLLRLSDGRVLMSYGHRRKPLGNQARVSSNEGKTWSRPLLLSTDGVSGDLGYPSTVQLADGSLVSAWYERQKKSPAAVLRQAKWTLG